MRVVVHYVIEVEVTEQVAVERVSAAKRSGKKGDEAAAQLTLFKAQVQSGSHADALQSATAGLTLFRELRDAKGEAGAMHAVAVAQQARGLTEEALFAAREAMKSFKDAGDKKQEAAAHYTMAEVRIMAQEYKEALLAAQDSLALVRSIAYKRGEALTLSALAQARLGAGQTEDALAAARDAVDVSRGLADAACEGRVLDVLISTFVATKTLDSAADTIQKVRDHYKNTGVKHMEALVLCKLAQVSEHQEECSTAITFARQAIALAVDDKAGEAAAHIALGSAYLGNQDLDEARKEASDAVVLSRELGNKGSEVAALEIVINAYMQKGDTDEALRAATLAMERFQSLGDRSMEGLMMLAVADVSVQAQDFEGALVHFKKARSTFNQVKDVKGEATAFFKTAQLSATIADIEEATWATQRALALFRKLKDKTGEAGVLLTMTDMTFAKAWGFASQGSPMKMDAEAKEALRNAQLALHAFKSASDRQGEAIAMLSTTNAQLMLKDVAGALRSSTECTALCDDLGFEQARPGARLLAAGAHLADGRLDLAQQYGMEARQLFKQKGDAMGEAAAAAFLKDAEDVESGTLKKEKFSGFYLRGTSSFQPLPTEVSKKTAPREAKKGTQQKQRIVVSDVLLCAPNLDPFVFIDGFEIRAAAGSQTQGRIRRVSEAPEQEDVMVAGGESAGPRYRAEAPPVYAVRWQGVPSQPVRARPEGKAARLAASTDGPLAGIIDAGPVGAGTYFPPLFKLSAN